MASLYVIRGKDHGQQFQVRTPSTAIGRDATNQIRLNDTEASRRHAVIRQTKSGQFEVSDCGSSNGTFINNQQITTKVLESGDRVQVGRTLMIFTTSNDPHSTRSLHDVEIVAHGTGDEPAHIRSVFDQKLTPLPGTDISVVKQTSNANSPSQPHDPSDAAHAPTHGSRREGWETPSDLLTNLSSVSSDWELVYQVSQAISRTIDLDQLLNKVLELIFLWIECDRGCIMLIDEETGQLTPAFSRNRSDVLGSKAVGAPARSWRISRTILDHVMTRKEGVLSTNAQHDSRWGDAQSVLDLGVHEAICVPMLGRYGLLGAIYIDTQVAPADLVTRKEKGVFDRNHLKLMMAIASQAALAVEDTQFYRAMLQSERLAAMGQAVATLSHHVKNILQGINGGSYLVNDGLKREDLEVIRKGWRLVEKNQERISNLVLDMLSFSKEREPELQLYDVNAIAAEVEELMRTRAQDANVQLNFIPSPEKMEAMVDVEGMHRALLNIVTNAIDAASQTEKPKPDGARVTIATNLIGGRPSNDGTVERRANACIRVSDNGDGIPAEKIPKLFTPFDSSKGNRGTGLGLPVSRKILKEHSGEIIVESEPGQDTVFSLVWPIEPPSPK